MNEDKLFRIGISQIENTVSFGIYIDTFGEPIEDGYKTTTQTLLEGTEECLTDALLIINSFVQFNKSTLVRLGIAYD